MTARPAAPARRTAMAGAALAAALATTLAATLVGCGGPARAAEPAAAPAADDRPMAKTLSYIGLSALGDYAAGAAQYGGWAAGGVYALVALGTEPVVYYAHETVWATILPHTGWSERDAVGVKTASYAVTDTARVLASGWVLMGTPAGALGALAATVAGNAAVSAINDLGWAHLAPLDASVTP